MPWQKANKGMIALLEKQMLNYPADRRFMFGSPTFFVKGNMFAGVHQNTIILKLSEPDLSAILKKFEEVKRFTPMNGHVMKGYAAIPENIASQPLVLDEWLVKSFKYASSLPPKIAKTSVKKYRDKDK
jgi:TfoX/Sxy family transcriptional regulator of competence genes